MKPQKMDGIKKRKARFWAMLTAFVLLFTYLGPAVVMAKDMSVKSSDNYNALSTSFIKPEEEISWGGGYRLSAVHYLDRVDGVFDIKNERDGDNLKVNSTLYPTLLKSDPITSDGPYTVKKYSDVNGKSFDSDGFSGWKVYLAINTECGGNYNFIAFLVAAGYCTVTFEPGKGTLAKGNTMKVAEGETFDLPVPVWAGHQFDYWALKMKVNTADSHTTGEPEYIYEALGNETVQYSVYRDTTFTAFYKHNVDFDTKGGTPVPETQYLGRFGDGGQDPLPLQKPATDPTKKGYAFDGWKTPEGSVLKTQDEFAEYPVEKDTVFTAVWIPNKNTVTYKVKNAETWEEWKKLDDVESGTVLTRPENPASPSEDKKFDGWYTDEACTKAYDFKKAIDDNLVLYGQFTDKENGGEGGDPDPNPNPGPEGPVKFDKTGKLIQAAVIKRTDNSLTIGWNKFEGAEGYVVYGKICYKSPLKKIADITDANTLQFEHTKLKKGKCYKYFVKPYKKRENGKKKFLAKSITIHAYTLSSRYTVAKGVEITKVKGAELVKTASGNSITASGNSITVKTGKTVKFFAKEIREESGKKIPKGHRNTKGNIIFQSNDKSVATITGKGKLYAKKPGICTIYAVALDGFVTSVQVKVE